MALFSHPTSALWLILVYSAGLVKGQDEGSCYGPGSIAASVILSILCTAALLAALYYLWQKYRKRKEQLILETDPEKGKDEFAFDNPGFKDAGLSPVSKTLDNSKLEATKTKWNQWSPLSALTTKSEKRKTLDDSAIDYFQGNEVKVVALRSHDFTGLGFNICGNMKEGIFIKDVLHRGPASESGKLNSGDRINSVTISFEHMVYEDALTILSYASPYEVIIEARSGKILHHPTSGQGAQPSHPVYRSSSCADLYQAENSAKKRLFGGDDYNNSSLSSNYSSLQKSRSNMTTLERKESQSPKATQSKPKKPVKVLTPDQLKSQLEQKILADHEQNLKNKNDNKPQKAEIEVQKSENKFQKFGIRVLPPERSPKSAELSQNDNNINIEKQPMSIDEVDNTKPQVKKRERKAETVEKPEESFIRDSVLNGSGIKRDANGIPQEIPNYMMNAAVAARSNRKTSDDHGKVKEDDSDKTPKKLKGKAPAPPEEKQKESRNNFDEIHSVSDDFEAISPKTHREDLDVEEVELRSKQEVKDYNSDSDLETDNQSSVNTIELNSSDITIHHAQENEDRQGRRTASTGDLTKIQKTRKSSTGTLERAQSLDITDTSIPTLAKKRKGGRIEDDMESDDDIFGKVMMSKEPRLSLILDGLNTFQRNRLKKSTEWGNLEDAILKLNQEDDNNSNQNVSLEDVKFGFGQTSNEFDALVNKINEIKRESLEITPVIAEEVNLPPAKPEKKVKNVIWPTFESEITENKLNGNVVLLEEDNPRLVAVEKRQRKPPTLEIDEPEISETIVEKRMAKPAIPEKKDFLISSPKKSNSFVPESVQSQPEECPSSPSVSNKSDETKTQTNPPPGVEDVVYLNLVELTRNFIFTEKISCSQDDDDYRYLIKANDTNISDDIKVSRHSLGSLERPKSDDAKMNVSNITVNDTQPKDEEELHSMEVTVSEPSSLRPNDVSELYTTALDNTIKPEHNDSKVTISTPDIIKNVTITEAINKLNNEVHVHGPSSLTLEIPEAVNAKTLNTFSFGVKARDLDLEESVGSEDMRNVVDVKNGDDDSIDSSANKSSSSLTYITEIQVITPNNSSPTNISEIEIIPNVNNNGRNLDNEFEDYVKNFETNVKNFESNIQRFENNLETVPKSEPKSIVINDTIDAARELHKIQEIAEEQLKKLPEMRFTTSSYESPKTPEKRHSHIEFLRSNFEKSPPKSLKSETKSRIPIATTAKTPPTSPERRDSRNLDMENDKAILELMSSTVHSTPLVSHSKYQIKPPNKNVTVTSIRSNSKIPSGLPVLSSSNRPPIPPRKQENDDHVVQVSTNGVESSFKQWVFTPSDHTVTNIVVSEGAKSQK